MQIEIPDEWCLYAWSCGGSTMLIAAPDEDAAYERAIAVRMESAQDREDAERWFRKNDELSPVDLLDPDPILRA